MRCSIPRIGIAMAAGLVITTVVDFSCSIWPPLTSESPDVASEALAQALVESAPEGLIKQQMILYSKSGFGCRQLVICDASGPMQVGNGSGFMVLPEGWYCAAGWPLQCFEGQSGLASPRTVWIAPRSMRRSAGVYSSIVPLRPRWLPLFGNTFLYGALVWVAISGVPWAIRRRRKRRGLCPHCAYPLGTSDLCVECGRPRLAA